MPKTSFIDKKNNKLAYLDNYLKSYLSYLKFVFNSKRQRKLIEFRKTHSEEETKLEEQRLIEIDQPKNKKSIERINKKIERKKRRVEDSFYNDNKRIWEIDFVRGFIIIGMLVDHFIGDFWMICDPLNISHSNSFFSTMYTISTAYWSHPARVAVRLVGVMLLLILSGISAKFAKKSWLRALEILAFGGLMSAVFVVVALVTNSFSANVIIGAITCIGLCLLIYSLFKMLYLKIFKNENSFKWVALGISILILVGWGFATYLNPDRRWPYNSENFWYIYNNYINCIKVLYTPDDLKQNFGKMIIGFNYFGSDWLALFPYLGYMFLGGFIGETLYKDKKSFLRFFKSKSGESLNLKFNRCTRGFTFFGKKSMWFYILHQPVFIIIIVLIALIMGVKISL